MKSFCAPILALTQKTFSILATVFLAALWPFASTLLTSTSPIFTLPSLRLTILLAAVWPLLIAVVLLAGALAFQAFSVCTAVFLTAVRPLAFSMGAGAFAVVALSSC